MMGLEEYLNNSLLNKKQNSDMNRIEEYIEECKQYMRWGGSKGEYKEEKDLEKDMLDHLTDKEVIKNQVDCDCPRGVDKDNYTIDLVIKAEDGYLPIELKHSISATEPEMREDIDKLKFYTQHYSDMPAGLLIYYTNKEIDCLTEGLESISDVIDPNQRHFYFKLISRDYNQYNADVAISFDDRWEAKK